MNEKIRSHAGHRRKDAIMKIAIAQINPIIGDFHRNCEKIVTFTQEARDRSCDLVVFTELVISGYPPRDLLEKEDFVDFNIRCLHRLRDTIRGIGVIIGFVDRNPSGKGNPLFNAAALLENGQLLHQTRKRLLPGYDVFDERRYFEPGDSSRVFAYKGRRLGLTICEDIWNDNHFLSKRVYAADPVAELASQGADLIINISASPFQAGKDAIRKHLVGALARTYRMPIVYANQVGGNDSLLFDGASAVYSPDGSIAAQALDFSEDLICYDTETARGDLHPVAASELDSVLSALIMGTRDYVRKCGFSKAVVGLSGGIDSALTTYIAAQALGNNNVATVFMPSRYTSADNYEDTECLARNLGVDYRIIPIDPVFERHLESITPDFDDQVPGVTEQNIQARIRGTILMALSNKHGGLLLTTGNKSELAVGYCTLYGDMNGGLAVISDVPKTMVWAISRHINRHREIIPRRIVEKTPSAELKHDQTDQDDLPPYEVLDQILAAYIEEGKDPAALAGMGFPRELVKDIVGRVDRNEYKRQQAPPGLRVTSKAFGYGRRHPIAQRYTPIALQILGEEA
ncbi:MAG: NAD+ synthase [Thermodesulfobacteriota bacterium]